MPILAEKAICEPYCRSTAIGQLFPRQLSDYRSILGDSASENTLILRFATAPSKSSPQSISFRR